MLASSALARPAARREHDPRSPRLVPPIAAGHRDPIVRALVDTLTTLYERRGVLRQALCGRMGTLVFPAFPELLARAPRQARGGEDPRPIGPDLERRRSDGMEAII